MEEFFYALKRWEEYFGEMSRVTIYSDGSGHVEDENKEEVFAFQDVIEFVNSNPAEIYNAQQNPTLHHRTRKTLASDAGVSQPLAGGGNHG